MRADTPSDRQLELAEARTEAANQRTQLAEERTFSAWVRTGLASLATGFAIAKLMSESDRDWETRALGALFIVIGGAMFGLAFHAYRSALRHLATTGSPGFPIWIAAIISLLLLVGAVAALWLVLIA